MLSAIGMGKKMISPDANIVPNGQSSGGGMFDFGKMFNNNNMDSGGGLGTILNMLSQSQQQPAQPQGGMISQPMAAPSPQPASSGTDAFSITGSSPPAKKRLESLNLSTLLKRGNNNGF